MRKARPKVPAESLNYGIVAGAVLRILRRPQMQREFGKQIRALVLACAMATCAHAQANVVINEIMFRPGTGFPEDTGREFIELYNTDAVPVDLSGWSFTKGITFIFPQGATIPAGGYVLVAANSAAVQARYGASGVIG